ncbi:methyl-accepting chemotaxis protein [Gorillibacterium sp. CAU 1737]|uniref:methyl-accepting chemotaxis protein n=1 Tax=Gorillibacterium sp. CAU 1737 TaxID=3140362 RepID=UPI003260DE1E
MKDAEALHKLRQSLEQSLPLVKAVFPIDVMFALTNREHFLFYLPGEEIDIHVEEGTPIPARSGIRKALDQQEPVSVALGKEIYGTPFKSTTLPVRNEGQEVIGAFTIGISLTHQTILNEAAEHLATSSEEIRSVSDEIAGTATELAQEISLLKTLGERVVADLSKTDAILAFMKQIADSSNLLGINASIEAAHAGEHGRGFGIVAKEIRKMADSSGSSAKEIKEIVDSIQDSITRLGKKLEGSYLLSERQAAATEQIAASMQQLSASAEDIRRVAQLL